jgi:hypothetical protein
MSYVSDLGLVAGSEIKIIGDLHCVFEDGDIITLKQDDGSTNPLFTRIRDGRLSAYSLDTNEWEHYKEPAYKVGDLVEVVNCRSNHGFDIGETVRLTLSGVIDGEWEAEHLDGHDFWYIYDGEYKPSSSVAEPVKVQTQPLVSIVKEVIYTVTIKGVPITLTQDELNELSIELDGFEDYDE